MSDPSNVSPVEMTPGTDYVAGALIGGKYRLDRLLGEGGMGSVWAAHNVLLDADVAIKVIRGDVNRESMNLRLLQEARSAARLGHPAIVRVFDIGQTTTGDPFIVMELLEGESLETKVAREFRLTAVEAVQLLLPIADALCAAHAKGIVHRDIKPDNVFLVAEGATVQPKLVDFGIAKAQEREQNTRLTERGVIVGSPDYMSPEQARGEESIDHRADIWSFCVMLYEIITGQAPFQGHNYNALLRSILESQAPTLEVQSAADRELSRAVEIGMAKDRAERWQSMEELGAVLARWLIQQDIFEDASGGSLEMKWVKRRTDPTYRGSRPSLGSVPEIIPVRSSVPSGTQAGVGVRLQLSEAPTSVGPVVAPSNRPAKRRLLLPVAAALGLSAALFLWLRWEPSEQAKSGASDRPPATVPKVEEKGPSAPAAAPPSPPSVEVDALAPSASAESPADETPTGRKSLRPVKPAKTAKSAKVAKPAAPETKVDDLMSAY
jgi:eukaryotic-like serine/threonine-protein kinase